MEEKINAEIPEGVEVEGTPIKDEPETTGAESQTENKQAEKEPSQKGENTTAEDNVPFHKHPRWIKKQHDLEEAQERIAQLEETLKDAEPLLKGLKNQNVEMPDWWKSTYGDSEDSSKAYRIYLDNSKAERDKIKEEVLQEIESRSSKEIEAEKNSEESLKEQVADMKAEKMDFDEHKLAQFMLDYEKEFGPAGLLDESGQYDMRKSLRLMQRMNPTVPDTSTEKKKQVASDTMKGKVKAIGNETIPIVSRRALGPKGSWRNVIQ